MMSRRNRSFSWCYQVLRDFLWISQWLRIWHEIDDRLERRANYLIVLYIEREEAPWPSVPAVFDPSLGNPQGIPQQFSFNPAEKVVLIQLSWKSRSHSTQPKKPSPFNPSEKAQFSRKSRSHSTHLKKPFPFNSVEKADHIQLSRKVDHTAA
jgi:hypothetical protein